MLPTATLSFRNSGPTAIRAEARLAWGREDRLNGDGRHLRAGTSIGSHTLFINQNVEIGLAPRRAEEPLLSSSKAATCYVADEFSTLVRMKVQSKVFMTYITISSADQ